MHKDKDELSSLAAEISIATSTVATGAAEVSCFIDAVVADLKTSGEECLQIVGSSQTLAGTTGELNRSLQSIAASMHQTARACTVADDGLQNSVANIDQLDASIGSLGNQLQRLRTSADNIQRITRVINNVAEQTNLLALNAAIEAARAGPHGKGFAVVASEVRALSRTTSEATRDIAAMLKEIEDQGEKASRLMAGLQSSSIVVKRDLRRAAAGVNEISSELNDSSCSIDKIRSASNGIDSTSGQISHSVDSVSNALERILQRTASIGDQAIDVSTETEAIYSHLSTVNGNVFFAPILEEADLAAQQIGGLFEEAIRNGDLAQKSLLKPQYRLIENTAPEKFHTDFDKFTDKHLPPIQEPILERHSNILFAGAVNADGYFPTHNKRYSKPLTGDFEVDLRNNRSKRIFGDRTGKRSGSHTGRMLLQTYKRDTGEIMHDLSVPIFINGRHWGGFRIGFRRN